MNFMNMCGLAVLIASMTSGSSALAEAKAPSWQELEAHTEAPDWFRDAKFGIYAHWGLYSIPEFKSEWYPRWMHLEGKGYKEYHQETYGADFHYHDFIPMFTAEKFDAEEWAELYQRAGAKFAGPVAEHHDGFAMWDSAHTPFNAVDMGPKRDIVGELEQALRARGMKFMMSFHHSYNPTFLEYATDPLYGSDKYAPMYGKLPREAFTKMWSAKLKESIDQYNPDLMWFDFGLGGISSEAVRDYLDYFFTNTDDAVLTFKNKKWKGVSIEQLRRIGIEDFERGRLNKLTEYAWLTDDSITDGSWSYTQGIRVKPKEYVLHVLIDIVSKNGQLLLNIAPKADGTIPQYQKEVLYYVGDWLKQYGESIYGTRPFVDFGEGPTRLEKSGHFLKEMSFTPQDIRYTTKGNTVYAILLGRPEAGAQTHMELFSSKGLAKDVAVNSVSVLGSDAAVVWERSDAGLRITIPQAVPQADAIVFKLETQGLQAALEAAPAIRAQRAAHKEQTKNLVTGSFLTAEKAILNGKKIRLQGEPGEQVIGNWSRAADSVRWNVDIDRPGVYSVTGVFGSERDSALTLTVNGQELGFDVPATGGFNHYQEIVATSPCIFKKGDIVTFSLKPKNAKSWKALNVRELQLKWEEEL